MDLCRVEEGGFVGLLATVDRPRANTHVVVLGGSDGGVPDGLTRAVAQSGFVSFGLAYFGEPGLPRSLEEIHLDYVERALDWFASRADRRAPKVAVVGASKGAELALLLAATYPTMISAVAALAPSAVVFAGINRFMGLSGRSSWSRAGEPLPFVPYPKGARASVSLRGLSTAPVYEAALANSDAVREAAIPVERSSAPILLVSGDDDRVWPASRMAEMITARMSGHGRADEVTHLRYHDAGHLLSEQSRRRVRRSISGRVFAYGGTPAGDAAAERNAWPQLVDLLCNAATA